MKPIIMTKEAEANILQTFLQKFTKEWNSFKGNMNETKFTFSAELSTVAKEKITILFTQQAYLRMQMLVDYYDTEVGWYGLVEKIDDKKYRIYDVKLCKQYVNGSKVDTEDEDTLEFFNSLTDEEAEHMHFQGHSHVSMSTTASGIDLQNQTDVIRNMGKTGFYIFQIWNKKGEISTYLYDLDNNTFYDKKDVTIEIEDAMGTISDFLLATEELVCEKKFVTYNSSQKTGKKKNEPAYLPGYYGYNGYEGWDW